MIRRDIYWCIMVLTFILAPITLLSKERKTAEGIFPIVQDGKWGYMDRRGKTVITPQFDYGQEFWEGFAGVKISDKWGYIDKNGNIVIAAQFQDAHPFSEGLAAIKINGKWGFINSKGKQAIRPQFDSVISEYPEVGYDKLGAFSEGFAAVGFGTGGLMGNTWGYINKNGDLVVNPVYKFPHNFSEGFAGVCLSERGDDCGFINTKGKVVINLRFQSVGGFSEGLARISIRGRAGFIDRNARIIINPEFEEAWGFSEGLSKARFGDRWGYIDKAGKTVIAPKFDDVMHFSEGLARVKINHKWGYIEKAGKTVIDLKFDSAKDFVEGLAMVVIPTQPNAGQHYPKYAYIDKRGELVWIEKSGKGSLGVFAKDDLRGMIVEVPPDSPAARAGLRTGDIIIMVNDKRVSGSGNLAEMISKEPPGKKVKIMFSRQDENKTIWVQLGERR